MKNLKYIVASFIVSCLLLVGVNVHSQSASEPQHYDTVGEWEIFIARKGEYCYAIRQYKQQNASMSISYLDDNNIISILFSGKLIPVISESEKAMLVTFDKDNQTLFGSYNGILTNDGNISIFVIQLDSGAEKIFWRSAKYIEAIAIAGKFSTGNKVIAFKANDIMWALLATLECKSEKFDG